MVMKSEAIVSRADWLRARMALLEKEKELSRLRDRISAERRALPWVKIEKPYAFESEGGRVHLADLFAGRSQLIVYHFMFAPEWDEGCASCSFLADHIDGANLHLRHHDVSLTVISRAPIEKLLAYRRRMGWRFEWVSSFGSTFNQDFGVSFTPAELAQGATYYNYKKRERQTEGEMPGISVFAQGDDGEVYHTYSSYARGGDLLIGAYNYLDLTPKGRNEHGPHYNLVDWIKRHDMYEVTSQ
jgi:predicted dithiol-disulfide oxidoreductase (DUF899 family)